MQKNRSTLQLFVSLLAFALFFSNCFSSKKQHNASLLKQNDSLLLFAHRGVTTHYPENSAGALAAAKQKGFKAIEIDIQKTASGELVIFHDENGKRLLNIDSNINEMHTDEIKKHSLLFKNKRSNNYVLTLDELFKKYKDDFVMYLDVKVSSIKTFKNIVKAIEANQLTNAVIVASSSVKCIFYVELFHPSILTALEGFNSGKEWTYAVTPKRLRPDFYSSSIKYVDRHHIDWLHKKNLFEKRIVFDVDSANYNQTVNAGFENIIVDYFVSAERKDSSIISPSANNSTFTEANEIPAQ